jgi:hypothetical protein
MLATHVGFVSNIQQNLRALGCKTKDVYTNKLYVRSTWNHVPLQRNLDKPWTLIIRGSKSQAVTVLICAMHISRKAWGTDK